MNGSWPSRKKRKPPILGRRVTAEVEGRTPSKPQQIVADTFVPAKLNLAIMTGISATRCGAPHKLAVVAILLFALAQAALASEEELDNSKSGRAPAAFIQAQTWSGNRASAGRTHPS